LPTQKQLDDTYMGTAILHSKLSKARRKAVGAVLVTPRGVTLTGFNGTPTGLSNECEEITGWNYTEIDTGGRVPEKIKTTPIFTTKPEVIHAELNCILKAAKEGVSVEGSTIYVTLSPCVPCAAMLIQAGIKEVVYLEAYRLTDGLDLLKSAGVECRLYEGEQ
jgi:dCMP deaminase